VVLPPVLQRKRRDRPLLFFFSFFLGSSTNQKCFPFPPTFHTTEEQAAIFPFVDPRSVKGFLHRSQEKHVVNIKPFPLTPLFTARRQAPGLFAFFGENTKSHENREGFPFFFSLLYSWPRFSPSSDRKKGTQSTNFFFSFFFYTFHKRMESIGWPHPLEEE